ncbi:MAG: succinate dehydrogenase cytochrome b subunit [Chitinophagales bacterium]|nr:succinate dehydrogenase cytochrome b subunit [Chitinophagales bacterium]
MSQWLFSSVGRKWVMAVTGLFLCTFLVVHLSGNLLTLIPDEGKTFNAFAHFMSHNWIIRFLEVVLFSGFLLHIIQGLVLMVRNRKSRPVRYAVHAAAPSVSWSSLNMGLLGTLLLVFLVVHVGDFFVESRFTPEKLGTDAQGYVNLYAEVVHSFSSLPYTLFYVLAMVALGFHLWHGFQSAFRSLGLMHSRYTPAVIWTGKVYTVVITAGFLFIPLYWYFMQL